MRVMLIGPRGFPNKIGGLEKHCEQLFPIVVNMENINVEACIIKNNININTEWMGIKFRSFTSVEKSGFDKIIYSLKATLYAIRKRPDIIHFQGISATLFLPLAKLFRIKCVTTIHSRDYRYPKWSRFAKLLFLLSEHFSNFSDAIITVSEIDYLEFKSKTKNLFLIRNGVSIPIDTNFNKNKYLAKYGIKKEMYIFTAARFTLEKDLETLIQGFLHSGIEHKLVIAGDGNSEYADKIKQLAKSNKNIILTGFIAGDELKTLFYNTRLFVMTSTFESSPFSVLEAFCYKVDVLLSDIEANKILPLERKNFFKAGNSIDFSSQINKLLKVKVPAEILENRMDYLEEKHNWELIAKQTIDVYKKVLSPLAKNHN